MCYRAAVLPYVVLYDIVHATSIHHIHLFVIRLLCVVCVVSCVLCVVCCVLYVVGPSPLGANTMSLGASSLLGAGLDLVEL